MSALPGMQIHPGRGLGFLTLGASLHEVLSRFKAQPQLYPTIDISYSPLKPLETPVILNLPPNGFRLRFDGADQRLRLIEVLDFTKTPLSYKDIDLVKLPEASSEHPSPTSTGPTFRYVYNKLMGPTFPGEYISATSSNRPGTGSYILSYPGIAFNFVLQHAAWSPDVDFVSLLSSHAASAVVSLAIFDGPSWQEARQDLMTRPCSNPRSLALLSRGKEYRPDEIDLVRIRGKGELCLERRATSDFDIFLNRTTPQDLIAELGPPNAIHRKIDRRLSIHKNSRRRPQTGRGFSGSYGPEREDTTDTDQCSNHAVTDDSDLEEDSQSSPDVNAKTSNEYFFNYFHHGFDIFVSYPTSPSPASGPAAAFSDKPVLEIDTNQMVATKILLHGNVPGSYPFNRYRRSRWVIDDQHPETNNFMNSETPFTKLSKSLQTNWRDGSGNDSSKDLAQKAMVLNRDWGDSPGSSCEFLGDWEEGPEARKQTGEGPDAVAGLGMGNTKLYGFPGLLFEVLKNDAVSCLTVY